MYSVKFYSFFDDGTNTYHAISCNHYSVYKFKDRTEVTTYQDTTDTNGVTREVSKECFGSCYIENDLGKTIDKITV